MTTRITVQKASEIMGLSPDFIRYHMRIGDLPIGRVVRGKNGKRKTYLIYLDRVNEITGQANEIQQS